MHTNFERNYVYLLLDQDGLPFYVGLGAVTPRCAMGYRIQEHIKEGLRYLRVGTLKKGANMAKVKKVANLLEDRGRVDHQIVGDFLSREEASALETRLIASYGRIDNNTGSLTNRNAGGAGSTAPSEETRQKIAKANTGKIVSQVTRERQSQARKGRIITPEWRQNISRGSRGKTHTEMHNAKVAQGMTARWRDPAYRTSMSERSSSVWKVILPDGRVEMHRGLRAILEQNPELRMSGLSSSGRKGKTYKGFLAVKLDSGDPAQ